MKYERLSFDSYRKLPGTNWTRLKSLRTSALQFKYDEGHEIDETAALRIGSAAHAYVLEPDELARRFVVYDGKVRNGKYWDEFKLENAGQVILNQREWDLAEGAGKAVLASRLAKSYLEHGLHEFAVTWTDEDTGLDLRGRADHAGETLVELKTTGVMDPRRFMNLVAANAYHGQIAYYEAGLLANEIPIEGTPVMIVVQSEPPHDVIVYRPKAHVMAAGRGLVRDLLAKLKHHRETNTWPGLGGDQVVELDLPAYALMGETGPLNLTQGGEPLGFDPTENW